MRTIAILVLCTLPLAAQAKPSHYPPVTQFSGDRYVSVAQFPKDVTTRVGRDRKAKPRKGKKWRAPVPRPRPGYVNPLAATPVTTMAGGFRREVGRAMATVIGGRPAGCPHRFCGCALAIKIFGRIVPHLNLAANWLRFPRAAPAPGMVAARRGHVFKLLAHVSGHVWQVWDANSGRGRIRIHPRSIAGYAIVNPRAG